jgi:RND family efflux transporter MFP subunit
MQPDLPPPPARPRGLVAAGIVAVIAAAGIVAWGALDRRDEAAAAQDWSNTQAIPAVHLIAVKAGGASDALTLPGTLQAYNSAKLYARTGGYLKAWYKDIGARVAAGTPLGVIDTPELDQQIIQARADLASARANQSLSATTAQRWAKLLATASVSRQEADEKNGDLAVKSALVNAQLANLNRLLAFKRFATITAPFAGVVTARNADIGDLVVAGASGSEPLFTVADVHKVRVYVNVPQNYTAVLKPGLRATLAPPDYPGRSFPATVIGTSGAINAQSGTLLVQLIADNGGGALKPGGYAQVSLGVPAAAAGVQIAASALIFRDQGSQVATVAPSGHVHLHKITIGRDFGPTVEVVAGLAPGERVVDNPPDSLADGELVRVVAGRG